MESERIIIHEGLDVRRNIPEAYNRDDEPYFNREFHRMIGPTYLIKLSGASVTDNGVVFNGLNLVKESLISADHRKTYGWKYLL